MIVNAYAKINHNLYITGKNPDGYHSLETVMQTISLCDTIKVEKAEGIVLSPRTQFGKDNIAYKAAEIFFEYSGIVGGCFIDIEKRIPVCGGFGGGSADAAAVLRALDSVYGTKLSSDELRALAFRLGADVPFLINGGTALCRGRGEIMTRAETVNDVFYLIAAPREGASTKTMFTLFDTCGKARKIKPYDAKDVYGIAENLHNDFESVFDFDYIPGDIKTVGERIKEIKNTAIEFGANGVSMTGSGSGVFAVFENKEYAEKAAHELKKIGFFTAIAVPVCYYGE